jgi:hypothetical protein
VFKIHRAVFPVLIVLVPTEVFCIGWSIVATAVIVVMHGNDLAGEWGFQSLKSSGCFVVARDQETNKIVQCTTVRGWLAKFKTHLLQYHHQSIRN